MLRKLFILPIRFYQKFISPHKAPCCRFTPSCSQYAIDAITEWGVIVGLFLALWRVLRCNPFCKGGNDPVPVNKLRRRFLEKRRAKKAEKALKKQKSAQGQDKAPVSEKEDSSRKDASESEISG